MEEKKFVDGLFMNKKRENAPDFVKGGFSLKVENFIKWLNENVNESGYVNFDILGKDDGSVYIKHNNWKPTKVENGTLNDVQRMSNEDNGVPNIEDIPF